MLCIDTELRAGQSQWFRLPIITEATNQVASPTSTNDRKIFIVKYNIRAKGKIHNADEVTASSEEEAIGIVREHVKGKIRFESVTPKQQ